MIDCKKTPWLLPAAFTFLLVSPAPARDAEKPLVTPPAPFHDPKGAAQPDATLALRESSAQSAPAGRADANGAKPALDVQATESEIAARVFDRVLVDEPGDGRVWARGRDWKASFGAEGATLIPFLGSDAPKNLPLALALDSARVGGVELALRAPSVAAEEETSVALDHGAVLERWILAKESVEQTFVVSALPARGELVLHVATAGELAASALGDGLAFTSDRGGLQCSGAVAIDARGHRAKASVELDEHGYALRVPAEFVTGAVLPITVDPVFSTVSAISNWAYLFEPDYAYDASTNRYCLVYQFNYSQSDGDVVSMLVDASNTVLYNQTQEIDLTADNWSKPRVANNNLADNFFVVAMRFPAGGGNGDIAGRTRSAWTNSAGLQNAISGAESGPKLSPDVGGDPALLAPTYYLVTYERSFSGTDHDVFARLVDSNGAPVGGVITIDNTGGTYDWEPRVSKSDGNPPFVEQEWTIVWARDTGGFGGDTDVYGATVRWDGTITNPTFAVSTGLPDDENPDVSSLTDVPAGARTKLVVFPRFIQTEYDIVGVCLQDTSVVGYIDLSLLESMVHGTWTGEDQQWARVETDGVNFCVLYNELPALDLRLRSLRAHRDDVGRIAPGGRGAPAGRLQRGGDDAVPAVLGDGLGRFQQPHRHDLAASKRDADVGDVDRALRAARRSAGRGLLLRRPARRDDLDDLPVQQLRRARERMRELGQSGRSEAPPLRRDRDGRRRARGERDARDVHVHLPPG